MAPCAVYLSAVTILVVAIIVFFARRRRALRLTYATLAPPRAQEAAADLFVALARIVDIGRDFGGQATAMGFAAAGDSHVVRTLERAKTELEGTPPTYANYLAVYRGLSSTDVSMLAAADAYAEAGARLCKLPSRGGSDDRRRLLKDTLAAMGWQLRHVVRAVHRLGAALDIE